MARHTAPLDLRTRSKDELERRSSNMKRGVKTSLIFSMALVVLSMFSVAAAAQSNAVPRIDGHPDLSGVWWRGSDIGGRPAAGAPAGARGAAPAGARGGGRGAPPPSYTSLYQPWAAEK